MCNQILVTHFSFWVLYYYSNTKAYRLRINTRGVLRETSYTSRPIKRSVCVLERNETCNIFYGWKIYICKQIN